RVGRQDALGVSPVEGPLHRDGAAAAARLAPAPMRIEPAGDVEGFQFLGLQRTVPVREVLEEIPVPLVGPRLVVAARPFEEQVEHLGDDQSPEGGLGVFTPFLQQKNPVALERLVAVLAEGDLALAELNVPGVLRRPEKRLRKSHSEPPVSLSAGPKGSPGPARHARTAGLHFSETLPSTLPFPRKGRPDVKKALSEIASRQGFLMSGRLDSNQRPPEPHSGALAKLRHAPVRDWASSEDCYHAPLAFVKVAGVTKVACSRSRAQGRPDADRARGLQ